MSDETARRLPDTVIVGRVRKPHGVHGEVVVEPSTDTAERLVPGADLLVRPTSGSPRPVTVASVRPHREVLLIRFLDLESRDDVEELRSAWLEVDRSLVPTAPQDAYYYYELVGCSCRDQRGSDLGTVVELIEDGGGLLLELEKNHERLLIPFVRAYVREVDVETGRIVLELPDGMIETCTSTS